jgi:hypothetical protein
MFGNAKEVANKYGMGGDWFKPEQGDNRVRIVSEFADYGNHFDSVAKKSVICTGSATCPICLAAIKAGTYQDNKPKVQFLGYVIDRKDDKIKMYRMSWSVFNALNELSMNSEYAFDGIPPYDITINRKGTTKNDTEYKVIASRNNTPLTADEMSAITELKPAQDVLEDMIIKQGGEVDKDEYQSDDPNAEAQIAAQADKQ